MNSIFEQFITEPIKGEPIRLSGGYGPPTHKIITHDDQAFVLKQTLGQGYLLKDFTEGPKTYEASLQIFQKIRQELNSSSSALQTEIMEYIPSQNGSYIHNQYAVGRFFENSVDLASNFIRFSGYGIDDVVVQLKMASSLGAIHRYSRQFTASLLRSKGCQPAEVSAFYMANKYLGDLQTRFSAAFRENIEKNASLRTQWELLMGSTFGLPAVLDRATRIDTELEKILVHGDFQLKNILIRTDIFTINGPSFLDSSLRIIDIDAAYLQSRLWDLIFLLVGGDEMYFTLGKSIEEIENNFALALEEYVKSSQQPFTENETILIINMLQIRLAHLLWHFGCNVPHLPKSYDYVVEIFRVWVEVVFGRREQLRDRIKRFQSV